MVFNNIKKDPTTKCNLKTNFSLKVSEDSLGQKSCVGIYFLEPFRPIVYNF